VSRCDAIASTADRSWEGLDVDITVEALRYAGALERGWAKTWAGAGRFG